MEELPATEKLRYRIKMKDFDIKIQEKYDFCVCSVLQAILKNYNIEFSQEQISKNLYPGTHGGYLVDDASIKDFLHSNGFSYTHYFWNQTPFHEPDSLLKEMNENEGFVGINKHVYVLKYFNDPDLEIIDPKDGKIIKKTLQDLLKEMREKDGGFGLLQR